MILTCDAGSCDPEAHTVTVGGRTYQLRRGANEGWEFDHDGAQFHFGFQAGGPGDARWLPVTDGRPPAPIVAHCWTHCHNKVGKLPHS